MTRKGWKCAAALLLLTISPAAFADEPQPSIPAVQNPPADTGAVPDTAQSSIIVEPPPGVSAAQLESVPGDEARKWPNPTVTLLKSMVVPGWGQITNRKYVKAALVIGLESWFAAAAVYHWQKSDQALDRFRADPNDFDAYYDYDYHRRNRSDFLWSLGVTIFVSMFDAYVDAHLRPYQNDHIPEVTPPPGIAIVIKSF